MDNRQPNKGAKDFRGVRPRGILEMVESKPTKWLIGYRLHGCMHAEIIKKDAQLQLIVQSRAPKKKTGLEKKKKSEKRSKKKKISQCQLRDVGINW